MYEIILIALGLLAMYLTYAIGIGYAVNIWLWPAEYRNVLLAAPGFAEEQFRQTVGNPPGVARA